MLPAMAASISAAVGCLPLGQRLEEGGRAHDLAALAVAALRHVVLDPGGVHGGTDTVGAIGRRFDGGDLLALGGGDRRDAGADGLAVQMHGAGAAQRRAATELGAGHAQRVAQGPEDGRGGVGVDRVLTAIHNKLHSSCSLQAAWLGVLGVADDQIVRFPYFD